MISLEQWRSTIGVFSSTHPPLIRMNWNTVQKEEQVSTTSWYAIATVGLLLFSNGLIFITAMLLMCSGDVELNPGPVNCKKCPSCQLITVPVKLRVCPCGHIFRKKSYRPPPKCCLFPVTTSQPATSQKAVVTPREGTTITSSPFVIQTQSQPIVGKPPTTKVGKPPTTKVTDNATSAKGNNDTVTVTPAESNDTVTPAESNDTVTPSEFDDTVIHVVMDSVRDNTTTIYPTPLKSQPVRTSAPEGNNVVTAEFANDQAGILPQTQPVIGHLSTSQQKWEKYKRGINKARRQKYRSNPAPEKDRVRQTYNLDPSPVRAIKREKYRSNPTPVKERVKLAYSLDPSPVRASKREKYRSNPTPVKERVIIVSTLLRLGPAKEKSIEVILHQ